MVPGRRVTAWISLLALVAGLAIPMLPGLHTVAAAEDGCAAAGQAAGPRRLDAGDAAAPATEHCVMCHWLRSARSATLGPAMWAEAPAVVQAPLVLRADDRSGRLLVLERPSRAPPSA